VYNPLPEVGKYVRPYDTGRRILLYTGGSVYEKGIFHLLKIWKLLVKRYKNLELYVANGIDSFKLRHTLKAYNLISNVKLLPKVTHEEVMRLIACADAAVVPSLGSEGLPYAVIEPMAAGRAVFASPVGGIPEILRNGYGGCFIDPWDSNGSADVLAKIVNFDEMVRQGEYAKEHIARLLTYENTTGCLSTVFAKMI
jgi:glycosyltransferase involved in cell wall biosynthesis